jgi:hypothetical protein
MWNILNFAGVDSIKTALKKRTVQGFHYVRLPKPGVSSELVQDGPLLQKHSQRHNLNDFY